MKARLEKLVDVKSIVTLLLAGAFVCLSCMKGSVPQEFLTIFTVVISFYFGTQSAKNGSGL